MNDNNHMPKDFALPEKLSMSPKKSGMLLHFINSQKTDKATELFAKILLKQLEGTYSIEQIKQNWLAIHRHITLEIINGIINLKHVRIKIPSKANTLDDASSEKLLKEVEESLKTKYSSLGYLNQSKELLKNSIRTALESKGEYIEEYINLLTDIQMTLLLIKLKYFSKKRSISASEPNSTNITPSNSETYRYNNGNDNTAIMSPDLILKELSDLLADNKEIAKNIVYEPGQAKKILMEAAVAKWRAGKFKDKNKDIAGNMKALNQAIETYLQKQETSNLSVILQEPEDSPPVLDSKTRIILDIKRILEEPGKSTSARKKEATEALTQYLCSFINETGRTLEISKIQEVSRKQINDMWKIINGKESLPHKPLKTNQFKAIERFDINPLRDNPKIAANLIILLLSNKYITATELYMNHLIRTIRAKTLGANIPKPSVESIKEFSINKIKSANDELMRRFENPDHPDHSLIQATVTKLQEINYRSFRKT